MSYVESNLMHDEHIVHTAKVHWCVFIPGFFFVAFSLQLALAGGVANNPAFFVFFWVAVYFMVRGHLIRSTTELAVTSKRVVAKFGLIRRHSIELNLSKVESFQVEQGILGRMLGYGTITVNGTGGVRTPIRKIDQPLEFRRNAVATVDAAQSGAAMNSKAA
jgi:uncharacterized membrane protein YdbT with pleckstrin-like domain